MHLTDKEYARFTSKTKAGKNGCIDWTDGVDKDGYGVFFLRRRNRRAHRVAWFNINGDVPAGMVVNHTCRNPGCVNPQHLNILTPSQNAMRDSTSVAYLNSQKTHCPKGHPFDRKYGGQRYCSICEGEKRKRLRAKWNAEDTLNV